MASRSRAILNVNLDTVMANDPLRELFEACKTGEIAKVKKLITPQTVNARDTAGRKSTPLHFAAGKSHSYICTSRYNNISIPIFGTVSQSVCVHECVLQRLKDSLAIHSTSPLTQSHRYTVICIHSGLDLLTAGCVTNVIVAWL